MSLNKLPPPILWNGIKWAKRQLFPTPFYGISGKYDSWNEALNVCKQSNKNSGYDAKHILDKVTWAIQEVRHGRAEFERDSVLFYKKDYNYGFLSALFLSLGGFDPNQIVEVVDFGGSLGSSFFQNRSLLETMKYPPRWHIIEQKHFVEHGMAEVPEIQFHQTIEEYAEKIGKFDLLILSAVIEYLEEPDRMLDKLLSYPWKYVLIDRSFYHPEDKETVSIQVVPPIIYDAQYPLWLRSISKQNCLFNKNGYSLISQWDSQFSLNYKPGKEVINVPLKGFLYKSDLIRL